ncbi:MAG TPA: M1 family metallopeptidase [Candidatus Angelobacter sp.]|nr:M1 family metallopeptidase [Candidatus Angelobacter sp.]
MKVDSYDLFLDVDLAKLRFDGIVKIRLDSETDVKLNSVDLEILEIESNGRPVKYRLEGEDLSVKTGKFAGELTIKYRGSISENLVGLYKAAYDGGYVASTQFEAASARRVFPCLDHPAYKAVFKLTVKTDSETSVISNMPPSSVKVEGPKKTVEFLKTPRMSTYLLYLGIGKFEEVKDRLDGVEYIVATVPGKSSGAKFPLDVAKGSVKFFESYFDSKYNLPKMHLIAVPEFAAGAMENWGAITFREIALLVDKESSVRIKKQVAEVIAHEVSHQWFGDLVTMKWWDDLWLNESFATFMAYKATDSMFPNWVVWQDFVRFDTSGALGRDSLVNTHPIEVKVNVPSEIEEIFDDISYGKGSSIIRMLEAYAGEDHFMRGVRSYLEKYKFSNAAGVDLWNEIEHASKTRVKAMMTEWTRRPGYPVLTVKSEGRKLTVRQQRFLLDGKSEPSDWPVPLTLKINGKEQKMLMERSEESIDAPDSVQSLKLNLEQTGFYRVYYDGLYDKVWRAEMSPVDRYGIVSDAYAFTVQGKMDFNQYLALIDRYINEKDYLPAFEVSDQLSSLYAITSRVEDVSRKFHRTQLRLLANKKDENSVVLRGSVASRLALIDTDYAKELASKFKEYESVEPDMKQAMVVARARTSEDFNGLFRSYKDRPSEEEKSRFLIGLTSFSKPALNSRALALASSGEIRKQHVQTLLSSASRHPDGRAVAWDWIAKNYDWLRSIFEGTGALSRLFTYTLPILGLGRYEEVTKFFDQHKAPETTKGVEAGLEKLRINQAFLKRIEPSEKRTVYVQARS